MRQERVGGPMTLERHFYTLVVFYQYNLIASLLFITIVFIFNFTRIQFEIYFFQRRYPNGSSDMGSPPRRHKMERFQILKYVE
jgi:hypothetical protein